LGVNASLAALTAAFGRDARPAQALQRHVDAAFLRVACPFVEGAAADVVAVFCQIGQVTEIGEGADHAHGAVARQAFEQFLQRFIGFVVSVTAEGHRQLANLLHQFIGLRTFLRADHVTQNAAQKANVFDQGAFAVAFFTPCAARWGWVGQSGVWGGLFHRVLGEVEVVMAEVSISLDVMLASR
jgi:cytolysin (calcineurin-like family phosphatase)